MVTLSSTSIIFALVLPALPAPISVNLSPIVSATSSIAVSSAASPMASSVVPPPTTIEEIVQPTPSPPVTFGDLTTPSEGGTFNDFFAVPVDSTEKQGSGRIASRVLIHKVRDFIPNLFDFGHKLEARSLFANPFGFFHGDFVFDDAGALKDGGKNSGNSNGAAKAGGGGADTLSPQGNDAAASANSPPTNANPANANSPPANANSPPANANSPPANANSPPANANSPPGQGNGTPGSAQPGGGNSGSNSSPAGEGQGRANGGNSKQ